MAMLEIREDQLEALRGSVRNRFPDTVLAALQANGLDARRDRTGAVVATDARGFETSLSFEADGSPKRVRLPSGEHYDLTMDACGRLAAAEHSGGGRAELTYGALGLLEKVRRPGVDEHGLGYDDRGNLTAIRYPDGCEAVLEYGPADHLTATVARGGARTVYERDSDGRVEAIVDPLGRRTRFEYQADALQCVVFADGTREEYGYDRDYQLGEVIRRDGSIVYHKLNQENALAKVLWSDRSSMGFDVRDGRLHGAYNEHSFVAFEHDAAGETIREKTQDGVVKVAYDPENRLAEVVTPHGDVIRYSYDADGRLAGIVDWEGRTHGFTYGEDGAVKRIDYGNGLVEKQNYAAVGRLAHARVIAGQRVLSEQKYGYDVCARLTEIEDLHPSAGWRRKIRLDLDGRVTHVSDHMGQVLESLKYDANGNIVVDGDTEVAIGAMDQPIAYDRGELVYDDNGNVTAMPSARGAMRHRYGANGQLLETHVDDQCIRYEYDALGRRVLKTDGTRTWHYGYHGHQLLWEEFQKAPDAESVRRDYLWCPDSVIPVAFRERGRTYWIQSDVRGAPIRVFGSDGSIAWSARYDAFGRAHVEVDNVRQPWRLAGQYHDVETGLHYQLCRYYAPDLKTYLARDPFWYKSGASNYSYAGNRVYDMVDPFGGFAFLALAAIAVGIGAVVGGVIGGVVAAAQGGSFGDVLGAAAAGAMEGAGGVVGAVVGGLLGGPVGMVAGGMAGAAVGTLAGTLAQQAINGDPLCLKCAAKAAAVALLVDAALLGLGRIPGVKRVVRAVGDKLYQKAEPLRQWASKKLGRGKPAGTTAVDTTPTTVRQPPRDATPSTVPRPRTDDVPSTVRRPRPEAPSTVRIPEANTDVPFGQSGYPEVNQRGTHAKEVYGAKDVGGDQLNTGQAYRGDSRSPQQIREAGGFQARDPQGNVSLDHHMKAKRDPSQWVSASQSRDIGDAYSVMPNADQTKVFSKEKTVGYNYVIDHPGGVEVNTVPGITNTPNLEVAYAEGVPFSSVKGWTRTEMYQGEIKRTSFIANPDYAAPR